MRSLSVEDAESMTKHANNPDIGHKIAERGAFPDPYLRSDALSFIEFATNAALNGTELHLGVILVESDSLIGVIGLKSINRVSKKAEIGYWIGATMWNKGYGGEAVAMIVNYAFRHLELKRIIANVFPGNFASEKILMRLGFVREGLFRQHVLGNDGYVDVIAFGLLKEDYARVNDIVLLPQ